jgi:hypothetical protein
MLALAALAAMIIVPYIFELYTFHLYLKRDPVFYSYSGARLWFFLISPLAIGALLGFISRMSGRLMDPRCSVAGIAAATLILTALLYLICDSRECYYSGPDGFGWLRLWVLLLATACTGVFVGLAFSGTAKQKNVNLGDSTAPALFFPSIITIFAGYYPVALVSGIPASLPNHILLLASACIAPFVIGGATAAALTGRIRFALVCAAITSTILALLFLPLHHDKGQIPSGSLILAAGFPVTLVTFMAISRKLSHRARGQQDKKNSKPAILASTTALAFFFIFAVHPYLDAPMNLLADIMKGDGDDGTLPTYYSGIYHAANYFSAKAVEVQIRYGNAMQRQLESIPEAGPLLAGIGVQSPNCCKDGLDYGYRADVLFSEGKQYLVARAWETCDQNIACSGVPWESKMYQNVMPLPSNVTSIIIGMRWGSDTHHVVEWYYRTADIMAESSHNSSSVSAGSLFGTFAAPAIENPIFNVGVLNMTALQSLTNPPYGNANFYQLGVTEQNDEAYQSNLNETLTFGCLVYYSLDGNRNCASDTKPVLDGDSHWKVLWKWGLPSHGIAVSVDNQEKINTFHIESP